jgi:hypothetical protein
VEGWPNRSKHIRDKVWCILYVGTEIMCNITCVIKVRYNKQVVEISQLTKLVESNAHTHAREQHGDLVCLHFFLTETWNILLYKFMLEDVTRSCLEKVIYGWRNFNYNVPPGRSRVRYTMRSLDFSIDLILPAAIWPLTEMNTRNVPGCKGRPAHGPDNFTAISEPIV